MVKPATYQLPIEGLLCVQVDFVPLSSKNEPYVVINAIMQWMLPGPMNIQWCNGQFWLNSKIDLSLQID
jgi:hypothetical protein